MEVSICIPIYEHVVIDLISELLKQGESLAVPFEICLLDDGSSEAIKEKNRAFFATQPHLNYQENGQNLGRTKSRNKLAKMAQGAWLIFLDNDVVIEKKDFLSSYLSQTAKGEFPLLVCGGCEYAEPKDSQCSLRYTYGKEIEQLSKVDGAWTSPFLSGNFMVASEVFDYIQFDETLQQYGYEDLLFLLDYEKLFKQDYRTIYNPIKIIEIDDNLTYLQKTKQAAENLAKLYCSGRVVLQDDIRLLLAYHQLKDKNLIQPFLKMGKLSLPLILFDLNSAKPHLKLFQIYKLIHFIEAVQGNKTGSK